MKRSLQRETVATLDALYRRWVAEVGEAVAKECLANIYRGRAAELSRPYEVDDWAEEEPTLDTRVA